MKMKAFRLKQIDKQYDMHWQSWLNHQVTATKQSGKDVVPVYKEFKDFFNYEKRLKEVESPKKVTDHHKERLIQIAAKVNAGEEVG